MTDLFTRAKEIGLLHVRDWLPNGREDNGEWVALNPTRDDKTAGSFKVNLRTGAWIDNATDDRGGDAVSLYAFLNNASCSQAASGKGYDNITGGIQCEAARAILETYDASYFPSNGDTFTPPKSKTKGDFWADWHPVTRKVEGSPELSEQIGFFEKNWGKPSETWNFQDAKGKFVFSVVRFLDGKSKSDRPFTLWERKDELKWRSKAPEGKYPLWNLSELIARPGDAVILCEGQKAASRGKACPGLANYVFTGWYGGAGNAHLTDWSTLRGRTVHFWPDADAAGRKAIKALREFATEFDINLEIIHPPVGVPKGWDLADAIQEERDIEAIISGKKDDVLLQRFLDDDVPLPFDIVGTSGSDIIFYPHGSNHIERFRSSALTKNALMVLADREQWGLYFSKAEGGIAWDAAVNFIIRKAEKAPVFDFTRVRGSGAWLEGDTVVVNTGSHLIINGEEKGLHESMGAYVYEKQAIIPYRTKDALETKDSAKLLDIIKRIDWTSEMSAYVLAGWLLLAPWGGVLRWRPHVWLVGPHGTGKSWIMEKVINPMVTKGFGIRGDGASTPAGVRQSLSNSSKPFVGDEMESDNTKFAEQIEQILKLFRGSSSGSEAGGSTLHGSADGEGKQWIMQSMACFASIGAAMTHGADMDRFTVLELKPPVKGEVAIRAQKFELLQRAATMLTSEWAQAFHARTYGLMDEVLKAVTIICSQIQEIVGSMRDADQLGTLMAGAWMVANDKAPTASEARQWLEGLDIVALKGDIERKSDEEQCLDEIMNIRIEVSNASGRSRLTVGSALELYFGEASGEHTYQSERDDYPGVSQLTIRRELAQAGLKPVYEAGRCYLYVASVHPSLKAGLRAGSWGNSYTSLLGRLPSCKGTFGPTSFSGVQKRYLKIEISDMVDAVPF